MAAFGALVSNMGIFIFKIYKNAKILNLLGKVE